MLNIATLITTIGKTEQEIIDIVNKSHAYGEVFLGNQKSSNKNKTIVLNNRTRLHIINMPGSGVSNNRNTLLKCSSSDIVTFADDDVVFSEGYVEKALCIFEDKDYIVGLRFNSLSKETKRPIKIVPSKKRLRFLDVKSFGVWGCFFKRNFLIENNLFFDPNVGPGTNIDHGEDTIFLFRFCQKTKKFEQSDTIIAEIEQTTSTWNGDSAEKKIMSTGYVYSEIFGCLARPTAWFHYLKNKKYYESINFSLFTRFFDRGVKEHKKLRNSIGKG